MRKLDVYVCSYVSFTEPGRQRKFVTSEASQCCFRRLRRILSSIRAGFWI